MTKPDPGEYGPYHLTYAFQRGYNAYLKCNTSCPYPRDTYAAQAWDRGREFAMRLQRWKEANDPN